MLADYNDPEARRRAGRVIRDSRIAMGLSLADLAKRFGISEAEVEALEQGDGSPEQYKKYVR